MQTLTNTKEVVLLLGGTTRVSALIGCKASNISMWMTSGRIPAKWIEKIRLACYRKGYWVESSVFGLPDLESPSVPQLTLGPSSPAVASSGEVPEGHQSSLENSGSASVLPAFSGGG